MTDARRTRVLIVGSGGNGISPAVLLGRAGYSDFRIITKHADFGGAWYQNTYPGCEVDVPSNIYQFGYARKENWKALYPLQGELLEYLKTVARDNGLYERTHFNTELIKARWVDSDCEWSVETNNGEYRASVLVLATGFLEEVVIPEIEGIEKFRGRVFHSSEWPDGYLAAGEKVAVIGSGSSATQIVPGLQPTAEQVVQFIRTPAYLLPKNNRALDLAGNAEAWAQRQQEIAEWDVIHVAQGTMQAEVLDNLEKQAKDFLASQVVDPGLRLILTPTHRFGCKRPLFSDDYLRTVNHKNVRLVGSGVREFGADYLLSENGIKIEVDTVVLATGFYFGGHILSRILRRDGQPIGEYQNGHPRAYKSISVAGAPNLFLSGGPAPNGQIWNGLHPGEAIAEYIIQTLRYMDQFGFRALEVKETYETDWKRRADELLDKGVKVSGGCVNYSLDDRGHDKAGWPGTLGAMTEAFSAVDFSAYESVDPQM